MKLIMLSCVVFLIGNTLRTRHDITVDMDQQNDCSSNWMWSRWPNMFSRSHFLLPFAIQYKNISKECGEKLKEEQLKIEREARRRQVFRENIEARLTTSSIFRDFYSRRYKK